MYDLNRPWQQTTDVEPVALPEAGPLDAPVVCIQFNQTWLPLVLGALMQLGLPAQWVGDDAAQQVAVTAATQLLLSIGDAEVCPVLEFRFTDACVLQVSLDGGATWADVPGWDTFAAGCYTGATGATGATGPEGPAGPPVPAVPPNPADTLPDQYACNIASYLADLVIKASIQQQVDAINAAATILDAALGLTALIPGLGLVIDIGLAAAFALNAAITAAGTSAYTTALASAPLWSAVQCAIFTEIRAVGYVDATNFAAVGTALAAISYTDAGVVATIADYWDQLGLTGVQAAQAAGSLYVGDCSACGSYCYFWDGTVMRPPWGVCGAAAPFGGYTAGFGWTGTRVGVTTAWDVDCSICGLASLQIDSIELSYVASGPAPGVTSYVYVIRGGVTTVVPFTADVSGSPATYAHSFGAAATQEIGWRLNTQGAPGGTPPICSGVTIRGPGVNPFGANNCT